MVISLPASGAPTHVAKVIEAHYSKLYYRLGILALLTIIPVRLLLLDRPALAWILIALLLVVVVITSVLPTGAYVVLKNKAQIIEVKDGDIAAFAEEYKRRGRNLHTLDSQRLFMSLYELRHNRNQLDDALRTARAGLSAA